MPQTALFCLKFEKTMVVVHLLFSFCFMAQQFKKLGFGQKGCPIIKQAWSVQTCVCFTILWRPMFVAVLGILVHSAPQG